MIIKTKHGERFISLQHVVHVDEPDECGMTVWLINGGIGLFFDNKETAKQVYSNIIYKLEMLENIIYNNKRDNWVHVDNERPGVMFEPPRRS